ncbi:MAG: rod shape-determining protein MreC [Patescibacteria group bacterium]
MPLPKKYTKFSVVVVASLSLLFFLYWLGLLNPVRDFFVFLTKPVVSKVYSFSNWVGDGYLNLKSKKELSAENKVLKEELSLLIKEKSQFLTEKEENTFLRDQLQYKNNERFSPLIAKIIGKVTDESQNALIIDRGLQDNLRIGLPVLGENNYLIGKIIKVEQKIAIVLLLNDDLSKISVKIQNQKNIIGVLQGEFGLGLTIKMIPMTQLLKEGDIVVTSGQETTIPENLLIGQIKSYKTSPEDLFQEATVGSLIDFNNITVVNVLQPK